MSATKQKRKFGHGHLCLSVAIAAPATRVVLLVVSKIEELWDQEVHPVIAIQTELRHCYGRDATFGRDYQVPELESERERDGWTFQEQDVVSIPMILREGGIVPITHVDVDTTDCSNTASILIALPWPYNKEADDAAIQARVAGLQKDVEEKMRIAEESRIKIQAEPA